jgi:hypothetical protein
MPMSDKPVASCDRFIDVGRPPLFLSIPASNSPARRAARKLTSEIWQ